MPASSLLCLFTTLAPCPLSSRLLLDVLLLVGRALVGRAPSGHALVGRAPTALDCIDAHTITVLTSVRPMLASGNMLLEGDSILLMDGDEDSMFLPLLEGEEAIESAGEGS